MRIADEPCKEKLFLVSKKKYNYLWASMDRLMLNIIKNYNRYLAVCAMVVFVLLTSCPVKSSIKGLAGIPVNTEQQASKKNNPLSGQEMEKCADSQTTETSIIQPFSHASDLLPAVLFAVTFIFLFGYTFSKAQTHPRYSNLKIPGSLPIFLQYRRLII